MIDFCSDTVAPQECMDRKGKIECRTVLWHGLDFPFRCEDKYLGCKQVQFDGIEEIERIRLRIVQNFLNGFQPFTQFAFIFAASSFFIFPVSGKSLFGDVVHTFASYLYFNPLSLVAHQCDVQCLIAVGFRVTYPVAQTVGMWFVNFRDSYIDIEAIIQFLFLISWSKDDTYGKNIINLFERDMLGLHLVPDGIRRFYTCQDTIRNTHFIQLCTDRSCKFGENTFTLCLSSL